MKIDAYFSAKVFLLMFIGKSGWAAPRLKDAALSLDKLREGYLEVCSSLEDYILVKSSMICC